MSCVIWWIHCDLRLSDNPTLHAALENHCDVVPLFILENKLVQLSSARNLFLFSCLAALDKELCTKGSRLIIRSDDPVEVFTKLLAETSFSKVYTQTDYSPYALKREKEVSKKFSVTQIPGLTIYPPQSVLKTDGSPYKKYTPYRNSWLALPREMRTLPSQEYLPACPDIPSDSLPDFKQSSLFPAGEDFAQERLKKFAREDIYQYSHIRNRLDLDKTSRISPYLKFGLISIHTALHTAIKSMVNAENPEERTNCQTWIDELIWREFYYQIMFHHPQVMNGAFDKSIEKFPWNNSEKDFVSWKTGLTGYPIVDAGMRQLNEHGWMHNRARMITASFLVKDLLINWQQGEEYFRQQLIDYDPASNNGGWQWIAGTGTDSVPYFRIFNPVLQSKKFDPTGVYLRKFVPELSKVPDKFIHTPWLMPLDVQEISNCRLGKQYPYPIFDHSMARDRILKIYKNQNKIY